jgi:membrane protease YdiL (CAAX protease family)
VNKKYIIISSLLACIFLYFIEQIFQVNYLYKTLLKIILFLIIPFIYFRFDKKISKQKLSIKQFNFGLLFGTISFAVIIIAYFLLKNIINFENIIFDLNEKSKITPSNFVLVGLYITFGNSFLEEFFFRGFIFLNLYKLNSKKTAYIYSSLLFGLYHIGIFKTWFNIWLILLSLTGLISVAFVFNWLDTKSNNFINSWIVHILADSAIIIIGMKMFNII